MKGWVAFLAVVPFGLAGCAGDGGDGGAGQAGECDGPACSAESESLEGVVLEVVHSGSGRDHRLDATVRNTGWGIFWYLWVPQCALEPWAEEMAGPSGPVLPREPEAHCLPCGWDALSPGESLTKSYTWDGRLWDEEGEPRQAPPGRYLWTVHFFAAHDEDDACGGRDGVSVGVPIEV